MNPVRLDKNDNVSQSSKYTELIMEWALAHPTLVFLILFITLAALFGLLFNLIYGMCTIESGVMRNFIANNL